jgi:hypothetical protein
MTTNKTARTPENLIGWFRRTAKFCIEMRKAGCPDNICAIRAATTLLEVLAHRVVLGVNAKTNAHLRKHPSVKWSVKARAADRRKEATQIEHVAPRTALSLKAIELVTKCKSDAPLLRLLKRYYRLAVLTPDEARELDRMNRSKLDLRRLEKAGIKMCNP